MPRTILFPTVAAIVALTMLAGCGSMGGTAVDGTFARSQEVPLIPAGVVSRAITAENPKGEPGQGGQAAHDALGPSRKGSPCLHGIENGATATLMDVDGCGVIRHIWITVSERDPAGMRNMILRMYWDNSPTPSVEVPMGDFFGTAHGRTVNLASAYVSSPLGKGFNSWFAMPFHKHARITVQNDLPDGRKIGQFFFQIDYELRDSLPANTGLFHAQFRRQNPTVLKQDYVVLDGVEGPGMYFGTVIGVRALGPDWWGEGEMKFYIDGDKQYPTICGTGSEDYFLAAYGMYEFQTPYHGCTMNLKNDFFKEVIVSMYRWHAPDPIYFNKSIKATIQQIGWSKNGLFERSDDWCSTAFWYQQKPIAQMPPFPDRAARTADIIEPAKEDKGKK
jgi:hypothetical protein